MVDDTGLPALSDSRATSPGTADDASVNNALTAPFSDDSFLPIPPASPNSTATSNDDPATSFAEQQIQAFKALQRRPGLGVSEVVLEPRGPDGPPSVAKAKELLGFSDDEGIQCELVAGKTVHIVTCNFVEQLYAWLNGAITEVQGPVDNRDLFEYYEDVTRPGRMRVGLVYGEHYILVSPEVWNHLLDWFGGDPCVTRKVVNMNGRLGIDVRGIELKIKRSSRPTKFMRHVFSVYDTVGHVKRAAIEDWRSTLKCDIGSFRIWDYANDHCHARLHPDSAQLHSFRLLDGQAVMFEEADPVTGEFKWDPETGEDTSATTNTFSPSLSSAFSSNLTNDSRRRGTSNSISSSRIPSTPGAVGLMNLGNTCFMNSTLQCLSNVWLLRDRFVNDDFETDINTTNPLGTGGKLARSFGDLMKLVWSNRGDVVSPMGFKAVMAEFKPEFSGYQQHDSQELLSFLLDGLHEDLNRVRNKPITQPVEGNGRPDDEVAMDSSRTHRMRNDSFVNDLFEGFYKSTVVCPDCRKVSVTFDPFSLVQLPVARPKQLKTVRVPVAVVSGKDGLPFRSKPKYVQVAQDAFLYEVRQKACAGQVPDVSPSEFVLCTVNREKIERIMTDFDRLDKLTSEDLIAFHDPNAQKLRLIQELQRNGVWHRPTLVRFRTPEEIEKETVDDLLADWQEDLESGAVVVPSLPKSLSAARPQGPFDCPFEKGDFWIGSLENRKYRMRIQITYVSEYGPWFVCMGYNIQAVVDVAPTGFGAFHERRDGVEEAAFQIIGYVRDPSFLSESSPVNCVFQQGRFLGSFGSYVGDYPSLTPESTPFGLSGTCASREFFAGQVIENTPKRLNYSNHSQPRPFSLMRWDRSVVAEQYMDEMNKLTRSLSVAGPRLGPTNAGLAVVTLYHTRSTHHFDTLGQPAMFTMPSNMTAHQLYEKVVQRFTHRLQSRLDHHTLMMQQQMNCNEDENISQKSKIDPLGLMGMFRIIQRFPGEARTRELEAFDEDTLVVPETEQVLPAVFISVQWESAKVSYASPLYDGLFGNLYLEDANGDDKNRNTSLYDCFGMFSEEERLSATEAWYCSNCKDHKQAYKKMELWQLPPVLVVHLKRFSQSQMSYYVDKDDTEIDFPLEGLDLRDRVINPVGREECIYDLVAVSHHYGGLGGGHYVAHARNERDGHWYEFDDSAVRTLGTSSAAAASRVKGGSAYVLFYVKRHLVPPQWHAQLNHFTATEKLDDPADMMVVSDDTDMGDV